MIICTITTERYKVPPRARWGMGEPIKKATVSGPIQFPLQIDNIREYRRACRKALGIRGRKGWRLRADLPFGDHIWVRKGVARSAHHVRQELA